MHLQQYIGVRATLVESCTGYTSYATSEEQATRAYTLMLSARARLESRVGRRDQSTIFKCFDSVLIVSVVFC